MKFLITIPAYNEEKTIGELIETIQKTLNTTGYPHDIQVIDDGSTDGTADIARSRNAIVYSHPRNMGLAETFRDEVQIAIQSGADIIVHIDADGQYNPGQILDLIEPIINNRADLVLGSRFMGKIEEMPLLKKIGNRAFSKVVSHISGMEISDAQTGFRAFSREVAEKVRVKSNYTYTQEQIIKAVQKKFRITEVPIFFSRRREGSSRLMSNPLDYAIRGNINMLRIYRDFAPLKFFGLIGILLVGIACFLFLYSYLFLDRLPDVTVTLLTVSGVQILLFGFLAEMLQNGNE